MQEGGREGGKEGGMEGGEKSTPFKDAGKKKKGGMQVEREIERLCLN